MRNILLVALLLVSISLLLPTGVYAHYPHDESECPTTEEFGSSPECLIEQRQSGKEVKFVDMYFSEGVDVGGNSANPNEIPNKMEVEPGDGTTILAAVMANSGAFELTGMKGWLALPVGFKPAGKPVGEAAFDTYDLGILPGATFVFEFPVEVTDNTRVGTYNAVLHVEYFKARDIGLNFRDFEVEFLLPGKSVIDAVATNSVLFPSTKNNVTIEIVNDGTAAASGVVASVGVSRVASSTDGEAGGQNANQLVNVGKKVFNIGVIKPKSKAMINPLIYVNPALVDTRQNLRIEISYFDAYGQRQSSMIPVNFLVAGSTSVSIDFKVYSDKPIIHTITETPLKVSLENIGRETAHSVEVTVNTPLTATVALNQEVPEASRSPISIIGSDGYNRIEKIEPGESADVQVRLFASQEAVNTAFQLPVTISYLDESGGVKRIQRQVSVYVQGTITLRINDLGITYIGNEPNISGFLLNEGTNMALFTTVELDDNAQDMITQVGNPQYLGDLTANSPLPFNIPVRFADGMEQGTYTIAIRVTYKDDLRMAYEDKIEGFINYTPRVVQTEESGPSLLDSSMIAMIGGISAAGVVGYVVHKKRNNRKSKVSSVSDDTDEIDFLDDTK